MSTTPSSTPSAARRAATPDADSGLRNPASPDAVIRYRDVTANELFEVARLVVAAEIAKIHTIEWTPQLLYDEPLYLGMNANWNGLFGQATPTCRRRSRRSSSMNFGTSENAKKATQWYSASGLRPGHLRPRRAGLCGRRGVRALGPARTDTWSLTNPDDVNGGVNHFGSPFNFPEEFVTSTACTRWCPT